MGAVVVKPSKIAHFVVRTVDYDASVAWYRTFLAAESVFECDMVTFLTFDDEHHRIAIGRIDGLQPHQQNAAGIDHIAFSYDSLGDLMSTYDRLKVAGIVPYWSINHGPTTSLYYRDPDGIQVEIQTDNIAAEGGPAAVFRSDSFAANPIGVEFDPDLLSERVRRGDDVAALLKQGSAPVTVS